MSASPSSVIVTCHCRYVQDSAPPFLLSLPVTANSTDLLENVLQRVGLSSDQLEWANFKVAYKLFSPISREGPIVDFVHPHTETSIEEFIVRVPENDSGEKVLDVSIFSEDVTIFDQTIPNMDWSPPQSLVDALDDDLPPPNNFQCLFVHKDTNHRFSMSLPATLTGRQLKDKIRISSFYEDSMPASAKVSNESLDVEVHIAGSSRSPGLKCKLLDAWPLRAAVLAITDDIHFHDDVTVVFSIRPRADTISDNPSQRNSVLAPPPTADTIQEEESKVDGDNSEPRKRPYQAPPQRQQNEGIKDTVCLGSTNKLCLRWRLKHVNPLKMT